MSETKLNVLHVTGAMNRAGTETMLMNLYRNIDPEKVHFDFVSYSKHEAHYDTEIKQRGGNVIQLQKTNSVRSLYTVMKKYGPYDVVHAHTLFHCGLVAFAAYLAGIRSRISHAHTTADDCQSVKRKLYQNIMRRFIKSYSTDLLACSNKAGRYLFGEKMLTEKNTVYFPNVIDYASFLNVPAPAVNAFKMEQGLGKSIVIGHVGRFIDAKNHTFLLEIMKQIIKKEPDTNLLLVGDGELRQQIEQKANRENLQNNIRFAGIREDIPLMMHSMDVFVFPSIYEGLGLVLLEAQASGVPCVVSEAIQPEADLGMGMVTQLSLRDSPEIWADRILELTKSKKPSSHHIAEAFEKNGYTINQAVEKLMNIYGANTGGRYARSTHHLF